MNNPTESTKPPLAAPFEEASTRDTLRAHLAAVSSAFDNMGACKITNEQRLQLAEDRANVAETSLNLQGAVLDAAIARHGRIEYTPAVRAAGPGSFGKAVEQEETPEGAL